LGIDVQNEYFTGSLSPSQVSTYMTCPAKWYFRYLIGLSEPTTGALALGKAFHGTLARNFRQKLSTGRDMEAKELREVFAEEWSTAIADAAWRDDEDAGELAAVPFQNMTESDFFSSL
jgi:CRISPR/Cas system-associated exonuclease Cas4 (RecB family)